MHISLGIILLNVFFSSSLILRSKGLFIRALRNLRIYTLSGRCLSYLWLWRHKYSFAAGEVATRTWFVCWCGIFLTLGVNRNLKLVTFDSRVILFNPWLFEFLFPKSCPMLVNGIRAIKNSLVELIMISYKKNLYLSLKYTVFFDIIIYFITISNLIN